ncbi:TcaA second domain-containing protein [Salinicoccus luteus]|uniref:TcaA second domain-containing protein n=1 Tax=Salinicoccus luteus TaxID=367840 RepID=UPI0005639340|nr:lysozyme inhibitor LprI family protein [Salinicoccus luteus]
MKRCKNCGNKLRSDIKICTQCGVKKDDNGKSESNQYQGNTKKRKTALTPGKARLKKVITGLVVCVILLIMTLVFGYFWLSEKYSPDEVLMEISDAVEEGDGEKLVELINNDISVDEADAYIKYIDSSIGRDQYIEQLEKMGEARNELKKVEDENFILLELIKESTVLFLYNKYEVVIPQYNVNIATDIEGGTVIYNNGDRTKKWKTSEQNFASLAPGIYAFDSTLNLRDERFESNISIDFTEYDPNNIEGIFNFNAFYTDLQMGVYEEEYEIPLEDIHVYINDQSINIEFNEEGVGVFGPLKYNQSYKFLAEVNHEGKNFKTNVAEVTHSIEKEVSGSNYTVPIKFDEESIKSHLKELELEKQAIAEEKEQERKEKKEEREREKVEEKRQEALAEEEKKEQKLEGDIDGTKVQEVKGDENSLKNEYLDKANNLEDEILREAQSLYAHDVPHGFYGQYYEEWDALLNEVWGVLRDTLPNDDFEILKAEQIEWIEFKEGNYGEISNEPASARTQNHDDLTYETQDRTYYLIERHIN